MPEIATVDAALERIKAGCHTEADLALLRQAIASGQRSVEIGGNAAGNVIVTGDGNSVTVQGASADALLKVLEDIQSRATLNPRDRSRMLQRVRSMWIDGYLKDSLHGAALQALGIEERSEAVPDRWRMVLQQPDRPTETLAPDTRILEVFDKLDGALLILGEPGSGKTMTLLELARALLDRAAQDQALPMPVVFPLSSWAAKRLPLTDWLKDELNLRYDIPPSIGQKWVEGDRILPLLDGLDEVAANCRAACVEAINAYLSGGTMALSGLVVTSRVADYKALVRLVRLRGAVLLQALSPEQIDAYLASAGEQLDGVRKALPADGVLRELATSPLLLSTITLAYKGVPAEAISMTGTIDERRGQLFATYVERMFARRDAERRFSREKTLHWLGWLAKALTQQNQAVFYLERLQPDWLDTPASRRRYAAVDRLGSGLLVALLSGLLIGLSTVLLDGLLVGIAAGLLGGLAAGLLAGLLGGRPDVGTRPQGLRRTVYRAIVSWLVVGVAMGFVIGLASSLAIVILGTGSFNLLGALAVLILGLGIGLLYGLAGALAGGVAGGPGLGPRSVVVVEALHWGLSRALRSGSTGGILGLLAGLGLGLLLWLVNRLVMTLKGRPLTALLSEPDAVLFAGLEAGLLIALGVGVLFALVGGLQGREVPLRAWPNQPIWRSARWAVLIGLTAGSTIALDLGVFFALRGDLRGGLSGSLDFGVVFGLAGALAYGGYACLSHLALRLVLWRADTLPLDTVRFLDYATERIFLRKVSGGYIFVHRLLQEYFAGQAISVLTDTQVGASVPLAGRE